MTASPIVERLRRKIDETPDFDPDDFDPNAARRFADWPDGRISDLLTTPPPPRRWFCTERLLAGRGQLLVAVGGSSKTRALYHLGAGAVLGALPWPWTVETKGPAALFLAEDTAADVHLALHALASTLEPEQREALAEGLRVYPLAGRHPMLLELHGQALKLTRVYDWMMKQLDKLPGVAFVGLDPALGLSEGDELSAAHARRFGEMVDRIAIETGACTIATAHAAKSIHGVEELGSHSARGSGAITDAVRGEYTLRTMTPDEGRRFGVTDVAERKAYVQLAATKGNHLPPAAFAPIWLQRGLGGTLSAAVLHEQEASAIGERELRAFAILTEHAQRGDVAPKFWREQCAAAGVIRAGSSPAAQEKAMQRIREALAAAGMVQPGRAPGTWAPRA